MAVPYTFATLGESTLSASISNVATSVSITTRTPFPQTAQFHMIIQDADALNPSQPAYPPTNREIVLVTAGVGTGAGSFTVTRAQEGTTAVAHANGSYVAMVLTAGAVVRLQDVVTKFNVVDYGATVYSTVAGASAGTDATTVVNAAITAANAAGGGVVYLPGFVRISGQITMLSNVTLQGNGRGTSGFVFDQTVSSVVLIGQGATIATKTLTASMALGARTSTITSSGYTAGDWISFIDNSATSWGGWVTRVGSVAAGTPDTITWEERAPVLFTTLANALTRFTPMTNVKIKDLTFTNQTGLNTGNTSRKNGVIRFDYAVGVEIENIDVIGGACDSADAITVFYQCRNVTVRDSHWERCGDFDPAPSQNTRCLEARFCTQVTVQGCTSVRSGGSSNMSFTGTSHLSILNNVVGGWTEWTSYADTNQLTSDQGGRGIKLIYGCNNFTVAGNVIHDVGFDGIHIVGCSHGEVVGNTVHATHDHPFNIQGDGVGPVCTNVDMIGNHVTFRRTIAAATSIGIVYDGVTKSTISGNSVSNVGNQGIYLNNCQDMIITDNRTDATGGTGIQLNTSCARCEVTGNKILGPGNNPINTQNAAGPNWIAFNTTDSTTQTNAYNVNDNFVARIASRRMAGDQAVSAITANDITDAGYGLPQFYAQVNEKWQFEFMMFVTSAAANTGGFKVALVVPASSTLDMWVEGVTTALTARTIQTLASATLSGAFITFASAVGYVRVVGTISITTAGIVKLQAAKGTLGDTITIKRGSYMLANQIAV